MGRQRHQQAGTSLCNECQTGHNARNRSYTAVHREQERTRKRDYYQRNRLKTIERNIRWQRANREAVNEIGRQWRVRHPGQAARNSEKWRQANLDKAAENSRRRRARERAVLSIPFTTAQLDARLSMFGFRCWMCGGPFEHVDHVKPLVKGGAHILANLRPACAPCNTTKKDRWPWPIEGVS